MYYVYMLRCEDNTIYTGITKDIDRRMQEHFSQDEKCAKYTKTHKAKRLECAWCTEDRISASKLEYNIKKRLSKAKKEKLIKTQNLSEFLLEKIDENKYQKIQVNGKVQKWKDIKK